jgi:hypothetical protein
MLDEKTEARLLGVDVGFSAKRPTTGIAALDAGKIQLARAGTSWESRVSQIPDGFRPSVIAIDGPLLPQGADNLICRRCAYVDYRGPIVEAFPNAFLAVLTGEAELLSAPKLKRGRRFDWLCDQIAATGRLESILAARLDLPRESARVPRTHCS